MARGSHAVITAGITFSPALAPTSSDLVPILGGGPGDLRSLAGLNVTTPAGRRARPRPSTGRCDPSRARGRACQTRRVPDLIAVLLAALAGALAAPPAGSLARERTRSAVATAPRAALHAAVAAPGASSPQSVEAVRGPSGRRMPLRDALLGAVLGLAVAAGASLAGETGTRLLGTALLLSPALVLMTAACWVDLRVHRLPNRLLGAAAVLVVTRAVLVGAWSALGVSAGLGLALLVLALARTGLGMGDVKLEAVLGTWLGTSGPWTAVQGLVGGLVIGGVVALALLMAGRAGRRTAIALGPSLLAGAVLAWAGALAG